MLFTGTLKKCPKHKAYSKINSKVRKYATNLRGYPANAKSPS
jgi:hypothetical protein